MLDQDNTQLSGNDSSRLLKSYPLRISLNHAPGTTGEKQNSWFSATFPEIPYYLIK